MSCKLGSYDTVLTLDTVPTLDTTEGNSDVVTPAIEDYPHGGEYKNGVGEYLSPLSSKLGTDKPVKARFDLCFQVTVLKTFQCVPSLLGHNYPHRHRRSLKFCSAQVGLGRQLHQPLRPSCRFGTSRGAPSHTSSFTASRSYR